MTRNIFILTILLLAAVFGFLLFYPSQKAEPRNDGERKIAFAVEQASNACLADVTTTERKDIENRVAAGVSDIGANGSITVENTRKAVDIALSEPGLLAERDKVRECIKESLPMLLGLGTQAPGNSGGSDPEIQTPGMVPPKVLRKGWIYYEEAGGDATEYGVFGIPGQPKLPNYRDLAMGTVLKARSNARLRQGPSKTTEFLGMVEAGTCVRIAATPSNPRPPENASSGGHLPVEVLSRCP